MRFHALGGPEVLAIEDVPLPVVGADSVLIRVETAGINFADTVRRRGDHYPVPTPLPFIPGGEVIGRVAALGAAVEGFAIGDRVFGHAGAGGSADYVAVPAAKVFALPALDDPICGMALMIQGLTAALVLRKAARMQAGDTILVQGAAGGVGSLAVQIARNDGAGLVIGAAGSNSRCEQVRQNGASLAVDYTQPDWTRHILAATGGRGVDIVLEMSGGQIFSDSLACLAPFGRSIIYGNASGQAVPTIAQRLIGKNQTLTGFYLGGYMEDRSLISATLTDLVGAMQDGHLAVYIDSVFTLDQLQDAHRRLESRQAIGKLVLDLREKNDFRPVVAEISIFNAGRGVVRS